MFIFKSALQSQISKEFRFVNNAAFLSSSCYHHRLLGLKISYNLLQPFRPWLLCLPRKFPCMGNIEIVFLQQAEKTAAQSRTGWGAGTPLQHRSLGSVMVKQSLLSFSSVLFLLSVQPALVTHWQPVWLSMPQRGCTEASRVGTGEERVLHAPVQKAKSAAECCLSVIMKH